MTTNDPRCLFVTSIVRAPSLDNGKSIIIQVINVPSVIPAPPPPSPVGHHAASAAYNHSKTRLPNRPQRMHDSDAAAPRRSLVSHDRKQKSNGSSERESGRHATAIESQFTCKARVKWGKINALFSSLGHGGAALRCLSVAHTPSSRSRPGRRRSLPFTSPTAAAVLCRDLISYCLIKPLLAPGVNYK